jgi:hypothetical protein
MELHFSILGIQWVLAGRVVDLLFGWRNWFGKHDLGVWNLVTLCLMWTLWTECNSLIFEDKASSMDQLKGAFVTSLFDWATVQGLTQTTLVTDFVLFMLSLILLIYVVIIVSSMCIFCVHIGEYFFSNKISYYL